ncbi:GNAT family N-acetyltransferase [Nocardioides sp. TRM66260-LWL]|uniref:GNAT family N-acetyltransferase n=1 Tax=Nocardioides sp. TRM66260-LWL TaxID=2874478 RepID=UPI001CC74BA3|nr:N-acetyltransferase [Nocardioides sp. TRM66260-LWL]MBZ5734072.1 GNAT family N-acetyltransferase [Nocardioides sp. TRM66260-LWL]
MTTCAVRPAQQEDWPAISAIALSNDMFVPEELEDLQSTFERWIEEPTSDSTWLVATPSSDPHAVQAAAYVSAEAFADRIWNLLFLAVDPTCHGSGLGTALISTVEEQLRDAGEGIARCLIVETSSGSGYAEAQRFYLARGFDEEARIRQFYGPDEDKIVFWKALL